MVCACELAAGGVVGTGEEVIPEEVVRAVEFLAVVEAGLYIAARADVGDDAAIDTTIRRANSVSIFPMHA